MTNEDAVKMIPHMVCFTNIYTDEGKKKIQFYELAKDALNKQIPKRVVDSFIVTPVYGGDGEQVDVLYYDEFKCPCCGWVIARGVDNKSYFEGVNYCDSCGQALDWSEEVEE